MWSHFSESGQHVIFRRRHVPILCQGEKYVFISHDPLSLDELIKKARVLEGYKDATANMKFFHTNCLSNV